MILREVRPSSSVLAMGICLISFGAVTNSQTPLPYNFSSVLKA
ncbi:secreted protein [Rhodopirellula europaea SH398]|uniref:Secreted protein n=2 Tax=Rhodopirellula europaea TaxID=1263866 RepID=M2B7R5_9BACT|nr:secreted protein [Rhodopirellula europaea 6C]EMI27171.1 secreted protein [Rhodopirellula europaea SH398]